MMAWFKWVVLSMICVVATTMVMRENDMTLAKRGHSMAVRMKKARMCRQEMRPKSATRNVNNLDVWMMR